MESCSSERLGKLSKSVRQVTRVSENQSVRGSGMLVSLVL